ncbi:uncharacterized protein LY89DRAFT_110014 [Mollisia scopiformis]|uniref:Nephrocystin 3-like N-terminal domain-containing protein n=1 Tax=Mollisia scopiformis TaxID=149040 RepID=A0A194X589_MOLSC|nr:uncharacterized protein LY89DRAFT_110014 [Mollisia scopiformis]KUJ15345.1 hypothetical protein LY89DRAFT_110014 [Mollisia scopiformis]
MLQSILYQLLMQDHSLYTSFLQSFRKLRGLSPDSIIWPYQELQQILLSLAETPKGTLEIPTPKRPIFLLLDGLDESEKQLTNGLERRDVFALFSRLCAMDGDVVFKVIVLSRAELDIRGTLKTPYSIDMKEVNGPDIRTIVRSGICKLWKCIVNAEDDLHERSTSALVHNRFDEPEEQVNQNPKEVVRASVGEHEMTSSKDRIDMVSDVPELHFVRDYLVENADGVILWVVMIIRGLIKVAQSGSCTVRELRAQLSSIPTNVSDVYGDILGKIREGDYRDEQQARYIFSWVLFASRPLRVSEVRDVIAMFHWDDSFANDSGNFLRENRVGYLTHSWGPVQTHLWNICDGLIEVVPAGRTTVTMLWQHRTVEAEDLVQLIHQTAKDYLLGRPEASFLNLDETKALEIISKTSIDYLALALPSRDPRGQNSMWNWRMRSWKQSQHLTFVMHLEEHPFLGYTLEEARKCIEELAYLQEIRNDDTTNSHLNIDNEMNCKSCDSRLPNLHSISLTSIRPEHTKLIHYLSSAICKQGTLVNECISEWARKNDILIEIYQLIVSSMSLTKLLPPTILKLALNFGRWKDQDDWSDTDEDEENWSDTGEDERQMEVTAHRSNRSCGTPYSESHETSSLRTLNDLTNGEKSTRTAVREMVVRLPSQPSVSLEEVDDQSNLTLPHILVTFAHSFQQANSLGYLGAKRILLVFGAGPSHLQTPDTRQTRDNICRPATADNICRPATTDNQPIVLFPMNG